MPQKLVSDELWTMVEPILPKHTPSAKGGRPRISDRAALTGIIFVLKTGIPWEDLPQEMGCGSGMTCWRRLRDWQEYGVWEKIYHTILQNMHYAKKLDWSRACIDSSVIQAKRGRTYRAQPGRSRSPWKQASYYNGWKWYSACCGSYSC